MQNEWEALFGQFTVRPPHQVKPASIDSIGSFERRKHCVLPDSYKSYIQVFGPGYLLGSTGIASPSYSGGTTLCNLQHLDKVTRRFFEDERVGPTIEQLKRSLFFGSDDLRSFFFWDLSDAAADASHEYGVYIVYADYEVKRVTGTFTDFIRSFILGGRRRDLYKDLDPIVALTFDAASE